MYMTAQVRLQVPTLSEGAVAVLERTVKITAVVSLHTHKISITIFFSRISLESTVISIFSSKRLEDDS